MDPRGGKRRLDQIVYKRLHNLFSFLRMMKSRRKRRSEYVARMGKIRNAYEVLVEKHEVKRSFGRPRHRYDDNIKTSLK
jgi:RNase P subunit RPR2